MSAHSSLAPDSSQEHRSSTFQSAAHHAAKPHGDRQSNPVQSKTEYQRQLRPMVQQIGTQQRLSSQSDLQAAKRPKTSGSLSHLLDLPLLIATFHVAG